MKKQTRTAATPEVVLPSVDITKVCEEMDRGESVGFRYAERRSPLLMVIEDENWLLELMTTFFSLYGFSVRGFTRGQEALDWYSNHFREVDLIFTDMKMPELGGYECFHRLRDVSPAASIVLMSGFVEPQIVSELLLKGALRFVQKPFDYSQLINWTLEHFSLPLQLKEGFSHKPRRAA